MGAGAGAEEVDDEGAAGPEPKMSANKSCVCCADDDGALPLTLDEPVPASDEMSSPSRSRTVDVSLVVFVEPTDLFSLTVPMMVALISGGGILSNTPPRTSVKRSKLPYSTDRCCSSSSCVVSYVLRMSSIRSIWAEAAEEGDSENRAESLTRAVRTNWEERAFE